MKGVFHFIDFIKYLIYRIFIMIDDGICPKSKYQVYC